MKAYHFALSLLSSRGGESELASASTMAPLGPSIVDVESVGVELSLPKKAEDIHITDTRAGSHGYSLGQQPELRSPTPERQGG